LTVKFQKHVNITSIITLKAYNEGLEQLLDMSQSRSK